MAPGHDGRSHWNHPDAEPPPQPRRGRPGRAGLRKLDEADLGDDGGIPLWWDGTEEEFAEEAAELREWLDSLDFAGES